MANSSHRAATAPRDPATALLRVQGQLYRYCDLPAAVDGAALARLPYSLRVLCENVLRGGMTGRAASSDVRLALARRVAAGERNLEVPFFPGRILLQDFLGVPAMVDMASLRDAVARAGGDPRSVDPRIPVDLVIDHSTISEHAGTADAHARNVDLMYGRNRERLAFLAWCSRAFRNFRAFPPETGIMHQVNLETLARVAWTREEDGEAWVYPDTMIGTDSHTTMVNGIGVLGWGVGGLDAEAAMLGRPLSILVPPVVGVRLGGALGGRATATDLVLSLTEVLRARKVVNKFVEFCGPGLDSLTSADRATIANMAPEYGATCAFFPVDGRCIDYLRSTGRDEHQVALVESYCKAQRLWRQDGMPEPEFDEVVDFDLSRVEPCLAGPARPNQRIPLTEAARTMADLVAGHERPMEQPAADGGIPDGAVLIAAITSCTNTANPEGMVTAGLLARHAVARGLQPKPWVKTSLAPGSRTVTEYLRQSGLLAPMEQLGFHVVGYACGTCNGNSGSLSRELEEEIGRRRIWTCAVLSGNRNFEGRIHPRVSAAFLASPALVIAYALWGRTTIDPLRDVLGVDSDGRDVHLDDLWPSREEIRRAMADLVDPRSYARHYQTAAEGDARWRSLATSDDRYSWSAASTYLRPSPFVEPDMAVPRDLPLSGLRPLLVLGDEITTDHIAPNGEIAASGPAGQYLLDHGVRPSDFNTYGTRRGNHELGIRSIFVNPHLRNEMAGEQRGGVTRLQPDGRLVTVFEAGTAYRQRRVGSLVVAGEKYGAGSSRDWAAKGVRLLGVEAVLAESFERIHRANLVNVGVLPVEFLSGETRRSLKIDGTEIFDLWCMEPVLTPGAILRLSIMRTDGTRAEISVRCRLDTVEEVECYRQGGLIPQVLRELTAAVAVNIQERK